MLLTATDRLRLKTTYVKLLTVLTVLNRTFFYFNGLVYINMSVTCQYIVSICCQYIVSNVFSIKKRGI